MSKPQWPVMVAIFCFLVPWIMGLTAQAEIVVEGGRSQGTESRLPTVMITLGGRTIQAVVAGTDEARRQGLLGWDSIGDDTGMLLDFGTDGKYAIHMEGMKFPIDTLWIDSSGEIKLIYEEIRPNSGLTYPSMFPCAYCLEVKAGFCKRYGVRMGQRVAFGDVRSR